MSYRKLPSRRDNYDRSRYIVRKRSRVPAPVPEREVIVHRNASLKHLLSIAEKYWSENHQDILVKALGITIPKAINFSLQFKDTHPGVEIEVSTGSQKVVDDLEPLTEEDDYDTRTRIVSQLIVRIFTTEETASSSQ